MFFSPEVLQKLSENKLVGLELIFGNVSVCELIELGRALESNTSLLKLRLNYLTMTRLTMYALGRALKKNTTLQLLDLQKNAFDDHEAERLFPSLAINRGLTTLNLSYNGLTDKSVKILADALEKNDSLIYLDLSNNYIPNEGANFIWKALVKNNRLQFINLSGNKIDHRYLLGIHKCLKVNQKVRRDEQAFVSAAIVLIESKRLPFDVVKIIFMHFAISIDLHRSEKNIEQMLRLVSQSIQDKPANQRSRELKDWWKNKIAGIAVFRHCKASFFPLPIDTFLTQPAQAPAQTLVPAQQNPIVRRHEAYCSLI